MSTERSKDRDAPAAETEFAAGAGCIKSSAPGGISEAGAACGETVVAEKRALRARMKALRAGLSDRAERDRRIFENLFSCPAFLRAESVFIYCSLEEEADTRRIIRELLARGKTVYLPRTEGREMFAVRYAGGELRRGNFGVSEPEGEESPDKPEVCILPLLAADRQFHRLGYGGGYYDRYFSRKGKDIWKIGLCYDFQLAGEVPSEAHDVLLDALVTDARLLVRDSSEVL